MILARINIDDTLRADPRFDALVALVGKPMAYGTLVCLWDLGMAHWKNKRSLIPKSAFEALPSGSKLIQAGFVKELDDGYYCSGAEMLWSFLHKNSESGRAGGLKSAAKRKETSNKNNNIEAKSSEVKRSQAKSSKSNYSSSSSSSSSNSPSPIKKQPQKKSEEWEDIKHGAFEQAKKLHGFDDTFCERIWVKLIAHDKDKPYKRRNVAATNWFNSNYTLSDWSNFKESTKKSGDAKLPLHERYPEYFKDAVVENE